MNLSIIDFIELREKLNQIGVEVLHKRYDNNLVFVDFRNIYRDLLYTKGGILYAWQIIDEAQNEIEAIRRKER